MENWEKQEERKRSKERRKEERWYPNSRARPPRSGDCDNAWTSSLRKGGTEVANQVAAPTGSKITALVLDWVVQDLVAGFDSPGFEVAGSSSKCAFASTVW